MQERGEPEPAQLPEEQHAHFAAETRSRRGIVADRAIGQQRETGCQVRPIAAVSEDRPGPDRQGKRVRIRVVVPETAAADLRADEEVLPLIVQVEAAAASERELLAGDQCAAEWLGRLGADAEVQVPGRDLLLLGTRPGPRSAWDDSDRHQSGGEQSGDISAEPDELLQTIGCWTCASTGRSPSTAS